VDDRYALIRELFDLPGAESDDEALDAEPQVKQGADAHQSAGLGELSMKRGEFSEAIEHFKRAVEQGRRGGDALVDLGAAYESADMLPQAYRQYKMALAQAESEELHIGLSALFRRFGRLREAAAELEATARAHPDDPYVYFRLAEVLRTNGYRKNALEAITKSVSLAADDSFYHYWMADLLIDMRRFEEALDASRAAVELSPADEHVMLLAALALWGADKRAEAVRAARLATELVTDDNRVPTLIFWQLLRASGHNFEADAMNESIKNADRYDRETTLQMLSRVGLDVEQQPHMR
jgi:tetratricopeptide (TPR) repeat protein